MAYFGNGVEIQRITWAAAVHMAVAVAVPIGLAS